jgi:hypothetical protein
MEIGEVPEALSGDSNKRVFNGRTRLLTFAFGSGSE